MPTKMKTIDSPVFTGSGLTRLLLLLKDKLDSMGTADEIAHINSRIDTLIGKKEDGTVVDVTSAIDTFNEIKEFLSGIEDTDLQSLLSAVNTAVSNEATRAQAAETALGTRVTTLEDIDVMTAAEVQSLWDEIFNEI